MLKPWFVGRPLASHEDETVEHHASAHDRDILKRLFQNDEDAAMHLVGICNPPEIDPISVDLVVRDHDETLREPGLQQAIFRYMDLSTHASITTDPEKRRRAPLGDSTENQSKTLLCICHIRIVVIFVDQIQRGAD